MRGLDVSVFKCYLDLYYHHQKSKAVNWQSTPLEKNQMVYIPQVFNHVELSRNGVIRDFKEIFNPDLPWAEDHFLERVAGEPVNPGEQYKNWPYYRKEKDDRLFREYEIFSHNYMERYWCSGHSGIRFQYGDLDDIVSRLQNDPYTRQAYLSVWHPEDQSNHGERVPCTLGYWFYLDENDRLSCTYHIRSCDAVRHFRNDLYMTARLVQWVAEKMDYPLGDLHYWIGNFHCFESDLYYIKTKILK